MTDRRASFQGFSSGRSRRSSSSEDGPDCPEALNPSVNVHTSPGPRRRQLRAKSVPNDHPESLPRTWVNTDKEEPRKNKGSRSAARKAPGSNSPRNSNSPASFTTVLGHSEWDQDTGGFLPSLTRIPEGKESKSSGRRRSSTASSSGDIPLGLRRRRTSEDAPLARRPIRQKHGSLRRRAETLGSLPNPSLLSVISGVTQVSTSSGGSTATITQKSYNKSHVMKRKQRKRLQAQREQTEAKATDPEPEASAVFQYMQEAAGSEHSADDKQEVVRPTSSSSAASSSDSSHAAGHDGDSSSVAEETTVESPLTSPASTRRSDHEEPQYKDTYHPSSDTSTRESSPGSSGARHPIHHAEYEEEEEEEDEGPEGDEDDEENSDGGEQHEAEEVNHQENQGHVHHFAMERAAPPRQPSAASSRHSDPHTRRLRNMEQDLRDHVLQNPQPQRDFQFVGGPSPNPHPAMPFFDPYAHAVASPTDYYPPPLGPVPPGWPHQAPPPAAIGYYSPPQAPPAPYPNMAENNYAMTSQVPMAPPGTAVQPAPFHHPQAQPPHYQPHQTVPGPTKPTIVGYELLANKLTELSKNKRDPSKPGKVTPIYRKFEQLNHRVLLHLQDELSELEEELRNVDECIAQTSPRSETGQLQPASRRADARYGSELHYRRTELLGRVYLKLGQYNQALSSFNDALKNLDPANAEEIQAYRSWMEKHAPIEHAETRFLDRKDDLLAVSRRRPASNVGGVELHQSAAIALPLIIFLPLFSFAFVPTLLGRLFIIVLIGAAEVAVLVTSTEVVGLMPVQQWVTCASIYFGLMALLAGVTH